MTKYSANPFWVNIDLTGFCGNWFLDIEGTPRRMGASAKTTEMVGGGINHLLAETSQIGWANVTASEAGTLAFQDAKNTYAPLFTFPLFDYQREATTWEIHILAMPPDPSINWAVYSNTYLSTNMYGGANTFIRSYYATNAVYNSYSDMFWDYIEIDRGMASNSITYNDIDGYGGYRIVDMVIMSQAPRTLDDTKNHAFIDTTTARSANPIRNDIAEKTRAVFDEMRYRSLSPRATWSAYRTSTGWDVSTGSPGNEYGMVIDAATDGASNRVNFLDHWWAHRNADSPGIMDHAYREGIGPETTAAGTTVRRTVHLFAAASNAVTEASIWAETQWSNARVAITSATPAWYEVNAVVNSAWDSINAAEQTYRHNKIDLFGSCNSGWLRLYSISVLPLAPT